MRAQLPPHGLAVLVAAVVSLAPPARANDSSYAGCSGAPTPVAGQTCVPEKRDDVQLTDEALSFREELVDGKSVWNVEARYTFTNRGPDVTLRVGFPIDDPMEEERDRLAFEGYTVTLDDAPAQWTVFQPATEGDDASRAQARAFRYDRVHLTEVSFPSGAQRVLTHRYRAHASSNNSWMAWHRYILRTGAHWKGGRIGHIAIAISHASPVAYDHHAFSLKGATWDPATRTLRWEASAWEPRTDLHYVWGNPDAIAWELAGLSDLEGDTDLTKAKTDVLRTALQKTLQVFRYVKLPARRTYDPRGKLLLETWGESGKLHRIPPKADPGLTLAGMSGSVRATVLALDRELTRRDVRHAPLPPAR